MENLPDNFAGKPIRFRIPYEQQGELVVANNTTGVPFADSTFLHTVDKPFEIHRMIVSITPFDNTVGTPLVVTPSNLSQNAPAGPTATLDIRRILQSFVRLRIRDVSKNENLFKNAQLVETMLSRNEGSWAFRCPYTLVRAEGLEITVDNVAPATFVIGTQTCANLRIEIGFQGYLIVVAVPSETR